MTTPSFADRLATVRARIDAACARTGRDARDVVIVGVTKKQPLSAITDAVACGIIDIGENYVQELVDKHDRMDVDTANAVRWHFIGHLQRNKVRAITPFVHAVHGVDSERLAIELARQAQSLGRALPVFLQVNTSGEASKYGVIPEGAVALGRAIARIDGIELVGLMTLAAFLDDPEGTRPMFRLLSSLRQKLREATGDEHPFLSMGMTGDFDVAVEEGATHVRIGTALFGERSR